MSSQVSPSEVVTILAVLFTPLVLVGLGIWAIVRRVTRSQRPGASVEPSADPREVLSDLVVGARAVRATSGDAHAAAYVRRQTGWSAAAAEAFVGRLG